MKKALFAPLCSGFIIPGLGQVINGHLKKGALILAVLAVLFGAGLYTLYRMVGAAADKGGAGLSEQGPFMDRIRAEDPSMLWCLAAAFSALWLYSVLDAAVAGMRQDRLDREEGP